MIILVIEDNMNHLRAAQYFFHAELNQETEIFSAECEEDIIYALHHHVYDDKKLNVIFATNYRDAERFLSASAVDGVISDIYFPLWGEGYSKNGRFRQPEPIGIRVAVRLSKEGVPFVFNSSGWNHGEKYQWICDMCHENCWTVMMNSNQEDPEKEAGTKDWKAAFERLLEKIK